MKEVLLEILTLKAFLESLGQKEVHKMTKLKDIYEFFLVLTTKISEEKTDELITKFKGIIESHGTLSSIDKWGKRKFAYEINKESEGNYILFNFEGEPNLPSELTRISNITAEVLRSLIVKKSESKDAKKDVKRSNINRQTDRQPGIENNI